MLFFLDIDGVMAPAKSWKTPEFLSDGFPAFSRKATNVLQNLISGEDTVILTTSHRSKFSTDEWKNIFKNRGINIDKLRSFPENFDGLSRKEEVVHWFRVNRSDEKFVIIDDDKSLNDLPGDLKENLILTIPYVGLTDEHAEMIRSISQKGLQPAL